MLFLLCLLFFLPVGIRNDFHNETTRADQGASLAGGPEWLLVRSRVGVGPVESILKSN